MKIIAKISILFLIILIAGTVVYAAEPEIQISGDNNIEEGTTKTVIVKVVSDTYKVGTITGKIETNDKIEKVQIEESTAGLNGWSITYNPNNKLFVAYKASGENNSDVMQFSYTVKDGETGNATITLSGLELSYISEDEYITNNIDNLTKNITIEKQEEKDEKPQEQQKPTTEKDEKPQEQQKPTTEKDEKPQNQQKPTTSNQQRPIVQKPNRPVVDTEENLESDEIIEEEELTNDNQEEPKVEEKPIIENEKENTIEDIENNEVKIPSKTTLICILVVILILIIYIVYKNDYKKR